MSEDAYRDDKRYAYRGSRPGDARYRKSSPYTGSHYDPSQRETPPPRPTHPAKYPGKSSYRPERERSDTPERPKDGKDRETSRRPGKPKRGNRDGRRGLERSERDRSESVRERHFDRTDRMTGKKEGESSRENPVRPDKPFDRSDRSLERPLERLSDKEGERSRFEPERRRPLGPQRYTSHREAPKTIESEKRPREEKGSPDDAGSHRKAARWEPERPQQKTFDINSLPKGPKGPKAHLEQKSEGKMSFTIPKREPLGSKFRPIATEPEMGNRMKSLESAGSKFRPAGTPTRPRSDTKLRAPQKQYYTKTTKEFPIYEVIQQVGEGTYGKVYKARNTVTKEIVAMKRLRLESEKEGFPITAIREIRLLQSFHHPNVVGLLEMMVEGSRVYMNFDYMDHDLSGVLNHPNLSISDAHRKFLFKQLMEGLAYLHSKRVIHRDIKASNILLDSIGRLKIADFGLARTMKFVKPGESPDYTNRVITLWYRPPELLLGSTDYGREVDIWGVGCLLVELFNKKAIFPGEDEISQVHRIFDVMGSPTDSSWPQVDSLPWYELVKPSRMRPNAFKHRYGFLLSDNCFDLAQKLLTVNPEQRITAEEALKHSYFTEDPVPEPLHFLKDVVGEWHEFETKKRRKKEREDKQRKDSEGRSEAKSSVERSVQEK